MDIYELHQQMTIAEKIGQLNLINPGGQVLTGSVANEGVVQKLVDGNVGMMFGTASLQSRRDIQTICVEQSRLRIPMLFASDVIHGYRTSLPLPLALSCTWNLPLIRRAAHLAATEARADGIDLTFAPMVDVSRDPRWGRVAEGCGESATLASLMASAMVLGFQGDGIDGQPSDNDRMLACVKHFAGYGAVDGGREYASVQMGPRELHASHLPPFLAAVNAGVAALMPGFHCLDRVPVTAHRELIQDVLRSQWNFRGAVISDYTAITELVSHGLGSEAEVARMAIKAGVDVDMVSEAYLRHLQSAVDEDSQYLQLIDSACLRVLALKQKAGLFDDPFRYLDESRASHVIGCDSHLAEARAMAAASCVLLKNENNLLPIDSIATETTNTDSRKKLALIGPLAADVLNLAGTWSVSANVDDNVSLATGLSDVILESNLAAELETARGCNLVDDPVEVARLNVFGETASIDPREPQEMIEEAVALAFHSDIIILAVGEAKEHAGECSSRVDPRLPEPQRRLIKEMAETGRPMILVIFAGRPLILTEIIEHADAILYAWYGGAMSGPGIADVLVGAVVPSAKLTMSMPRSVGQIPVHHDALPTGRPLPRATEFEKFKSCYLDNSNKPLYPFGYGLTYSKFEYGEATASESEGGIRVESTIRNVGDRQATEVVQMYASPPAGETSPPGLMLVDFQRVTLAAGESRSVELIFNRDAVALPVGDSVASTKLVFRPGRYRLGIGGDSSNLTMTEIDWFPKSNETEDHMQTMS